MLVSFMSKYGVLSILHLALRCRQSVSLDFLLVESSGRLDPWEIRIIYSV